MPKVPRLLAPVIERIPHSRAYQVTADGLAIAWTLFFTRLAQRLLIPGLAQLTDPNPPPGMRLRQAARAYQAAITELAQPAGIHRRLTPTVTTAGLVHGPSRHTRRNLTRNSKSLRGKITYCASASRLAAILLTRVLAATPPLSLRRSRSPPAPGFRV